MSNENEVKAPLDMSAFFVLEKANKGREFPLVLPNGEASGYSLTLISRHSDQVAQVLELAQRRRLQNAMKPEAERVSDRAINAPVIVAMVSGWNLPNEFTSENVAMFLKNAPQVAEAVDRFSWNDAHFFGSV